MFEAQMLGLNSSTGKYSVLVNNVNGGYAIRDFEDEKDALRFTKEVNLERQPDFDKIEIGAKSAKKKGGLGKAAASVLVTGLGQCCDGRYKDGAKQYFGQLGLGVLAYCATIAAMGAKSKNAAIALLGAGTAAGIGALAVKIHSIIDAYKK